MFRTVAGAALLLAAAAATSPAAAQSWGFSVGAGFGAPVYVGPPPVYYEAPVYGAPPPVIFRRAPGVIPMQAPEVVFDRLEDAGYQEFSPMARRGNLYRLNAVDPDGDLVALEISIFTGEIERTRILQARISPAPPKVTPAPRRKAVAARRPAPAPAAPPPAAASAPPPPPAAAPSGDAPSTLRDRLDTSPGEPAGSDNEPDPLVVY